MATKATGGTTEDMTIAVAFGNKPALRAALAGMVGVNINHSNATFSSLVLNEPAQLPESPGVLNEALLSGHTNSLPNVPQVFYDDDIARGTGVDNGFGDPVVEVGH
jgi:hypothetical protein